MVASHPYTWLAVIASKPVTILQYHSVPTWGLPSKTLIGPFGSSCQFDFDAVDFIQMRLKQKPNLCCFLQELIYRSLLN